MLDHDVRWEQTAQTALGKTEGGFLPAFTAGALLLYKARAVPGPVLCLFQHPHQ